MKLLAKQLLILTCMTGAAAILCACSSTPRGLGHQITRPVETNLDAPQNDIEVSFASAVSQMASGVQSAMNSPLGYGQVWVTGVYQNGLGESCKRVTVRTEKKTENRIAVCLTKQGQWRYVPPLY